MTDKFRAIIIDDERPARRWIAELLAEHPGIEIAGEAGGVASAIELADRVRPDIAFLDVQMPPGTGFDILPHLPPETRVVFVTAHDVYAIRAFEMNALDYLLKPVHPDRLRATLSRLSSPVRAGINREAVSSGALGINDLVVLRDREALRIVRAGEIAAIQAEGAYSRVLFRSGGSMLVLRALGVWEGQLPAPPFERIHRSLIIHLDAVRELSTLARDDARVRIEGVPDPIPLRRAASLRLRRGLATRRAAPEKKSVSGQSAGIKHGS